jgi:hypothetical protein
VHEANTATELADLLRNAGVSLVAVDGSHGSGKSHLANELGALLGMDVLHLDDFVAKNQGDYVRNINFASVSAALSVTPALIVEGICVLQILEIVGVTEDAFVYVKRMAHGNWLDEDDLDAELPIDEHLAALRAEIQPIARKLGESGELGLAEEVIRYHAKYRPHNRASIIFLRNDS